LTLENQLHEWLSLDAERRELRDREREITRLLTGLEEGILEMFAQAGITKMSVAGRTVYVAKSLRVSPKKEEHEGQEYVPWQRVCDTLEKCGFSDYVQRRADTRTIGALLREIERDPHQGIPPELREVFNIYEQYQLRSRKA
jgi:hypothetical protein